MKKIKLFGGFHNVDAINIQVSDNKFEELEMEQNMLPDGPVILPMYKQYLSIKEKNPECVILIRLDDLYETYCEDAVSVSEILGITLTRRNNNGKSNYAAAEMVGFPHHALDTYLPKLIRAGKRVAICESVLTNEQIKL